MTEETGLTRRQALGAAAALCGVGALGLVGAGSAQANTPLKVRLADYRLILNKVGSSAPVGALNGRQVAVVRLSKNKYGAVDRTCPHMGATVTPSRGGWLCPAHQSRFEIDGDLVKGPATRGLRRLKVRRKGGFLYITER